MLAARTLQYNSGWYSAGFPLPLAPGGAMF